ncbi:hypothetical protein CSAL01_13010 [Colletotrichum salicis]|uniref:Uncharacterized protein n=1 Tax=Colletotrichum salicis TaxID=1209931 RepID=A0A135UPF2_9PEZI|nr:hypothetical protein CSAL01_13010 [Colletotrichum salicis]
MPSLPPPLHLKSHAFASLPIPPSPINQPKKRQHQHIHNPDGRPQRKVIRHPVPPKRRAERIDPVQRHLPQQLAPLKIIQKREPAPVLAPRQRLAPNPLVHHNAPVVVPRQHKDRDRPAAHELLPVGAVEPEERRDEARPGQPVP